MTPSVAEAPIDLNGDHEDWQHARLSAALSELRTAVLAGRWDQAAVLCALIGPAASDARLLLDQVAEQATLHARAAQVLGTAGPAALVRSGQAPGISGAGAPLALAVRRSLAALDGDHAQAAALFRESLPADCTPGSSGALPPRCDVGQLNVSRHAGDLVRVTGVARPSPGGGFAIGDPGSHRTLPVAVGGDLVARGTPVEVVGRWDNDRMILDCRSYVTLRHVPDYPKVCAVVEGLCSRAGLAAEPTQARLAPFRELDRRAVQARNRRREGEWNAVLAAAELLEDALSSSQLSLEVLARVHEATTGPAMARDGCLRQTPAVIRWCGVITYRAPPVAAARSQTRSYLRDLAANLREGGPGRHPAALAAEAVASLTTSHPFTDGNGRVARAVASWLLLRSGFQRRAGGTLGTFLDAHVREHYRTLRNFQVSPWGWHQLFYDAVLAIFERSHDVTAAHAPPPAGRASSDTP